MYMHESACQGLLKKEQNEGLFEHFPIQNMERIIHGYE